MYWGLTTVAMCNAGTPHKPPILNSSGYCIFESMACSDFLINLGVHPDRLLRETSSFDTIGNGYFAACIHAIPRRWQNVIVVTSDFHMPRSRAIFEKIFGLVSLDFGLRCGVLLHHHSPFTACGGMLTPWG
jgi:uncharacterized SAM-binding protein YcdF (DUF218 family)